MRKNGGHTLSRRSVNTAADARVTKMDDKTGMCGSGGVMIAAANHMTSAVSAEGGKVKVGDEYGRIAETWIGCQVRSWEFKFCERM